MEQSKLHNLSSTLHSCSVDDFNENFLQLISLQDLIDIIFINPDYKTVFRASWALEHLLFQNKNLLLSHRNDIFKIYLQTINWSALRSITKLIIEILKTPSISKLSEELEGHLLDKTFQLLDDKECPIAVRCNCYDLIYLLAQKNKWVLSELKTQLYFDLEKNPTPALKSRANRIINKISS